ncbi:MAG: hypothetical protein KDH94_03940 [Coxiellaceae bacterium]|nr:hypothetical protein [Coxiellaceae bacterium]
MPTVQVQPTEMAGWYDLIKDAQFSYGWSLDEDLEHYLALLLHRFTNQPNVLSSILAMEYLSASEQGRAYKREVMRDVGDKCLLFSGLFPEQADKRRVSINYYVDLGQSAYYHVAEAASDQENLAQLFDGLVTHFVGMMDILHSIREMSGMQRQLSLLHAFDLWQHTDSRYAKAVIERHTDGFLVR